MPRLLILILTNIFFCLSVANAYVAEGDDCSPNSTNTDEMCNKGYSCDRIRQGTTIIGNKCTKCTNGPNDALYTTAGWSNGANVCPYRVTCSYGYILTPGTGTNPDECTACPENTEFPSLTYYYSLDGTNDKYTAKELFLETINTDYNATNPTCTPCSAHTHSAGAGAGCTPNIYRITINLNRPWIENDTEKKYIYVKYGHTSTGLITGFTLPMDKNYTTMAERDDANLDFSAQYIPIGLFEEPSNCKYEFNAWKSEFPPDDPIYKSDENYDILGYGLPTTTYYSSDTDVSLTYWSNQSSDYGIEIKYDKSTDEDTTAAYEDNILFAGTGKYYAPNINAYKADCTTLENRCLTSPIPEDLKNQAFEYYECDGCGGNQTKVNPGDLINEPDSACPGDYGPITLTAIWTQCPTRFYCENGIKIQCPAGYYCPAGSAEPTKCDAGYYCPDGSDKPTKCDSGYYCPDGKTKIKCDTGYYCPAGSAAQTQCPAGYYCPDSNTKTQCDAGYYCPAGSAEPTKCPAGATSTASATDIINCFMGGENGTKFCTTQYGCFTIPQNIYNNNKSTN